jgi:hypothetical protein
MFYRSANSLAPIHFRDDFTNTCIVVARDGGGGLRGEGSDDGEKEERTTA